MSKEKLFNEAIKYKKQNPDFSPERLFYDFNSWIKIRNIDKIDQVFAFRKLIKIFEIDYKTPFIESAVSDNNEVLNFEEIEKWAKSFEQSQKDKNKETMK